MQWGSARDLGLNFHPKEPLTMRIFVQSKIPDGLSSGIENPPRVYCRKEGRNTVQYVCLGVSDQSVQRNVNFSLHVVLPFKF